MKKLSKLLAILLVTLLVFQAGGMIFAEENSAVSEEAVTSESLAPEDTIIAKVNDYEISLLEANYILGSTFYQWTQGAAFHPMSSEMLSSVVEQDGEKTSMREHMLKFLGTFLKEHYALYDAALEAGLDISEEEEQGYEKFASQFELTAAQTGMEAAEMVNYLFGPGATTENLRPIIERHLLTSRYQAELYDGYEITDEELEDEYDEYSENYDVADFHFFAFMDEEMNQDAEEETEVKSFKKEAEEMAEAITSEEDFVNQAKANATVSQQEALEADPSLTLVSLKKQQLPKDISEWVFDNAREEGDVSALSLEGGVDAVVMFVKREKDENRPYSSRHILLKSKDEQGNDKDALKLVAETIIEQFNSGKKLEDNFAELAVEFSEDPGSASEGGLYTDIWPGQFVPEYEAWCLDESREEGDIGLVYVESPAYTGYHIIYFIGLGQPAWKLEAEHNIRLDKSQAQLDEMLKDYTYEPFEEAQDELLKITAQE